MSKKRIVLADNSYTIRKIVELTFSDEEEIELFTFENGLNLREKLLELKPQVVIVDVKLPEFNGYDVCHFIQGTDSLKHCKVFLLKGGFEPIDEGLLQDLKYEDIITKPFDSNALVSNIKKLLEDMPVQTPPDAIIEMPSSLPEDEDLPEIDTSSDPEREISFSDIKDEIESEDIMEENHFAQVPGSFPDDEIQPSEEITRAQPESERDTISPSLDEDDNPFVEDAPAVIRREKDDDESSGSITEEELNIKQNIELLERELEIDSLTVEEINIKKDIERQIKEREQNEKDLDSNAVIDDEGSELDADTSEMFPESKLEPESDFMSIEKQKSEAEITDSSPLTSPEPDSVDEMFSEEKIGEPELPEIQYEQVLDDKESILDIPSEEEPISKESDILDSNQVEDRADFVSDFQMSKTETPSFTSPIETISGGNETSDQSSLEEIESSEFMEESFSSETIDREAPEQEVQVPEPQVAAPEEVSEPSISTEAVLDNIEDKLTQAIKEMLWEIVPPLAEKVIKEEIEALKTQIEESVKE